MTPTYVKLLIMRSTGGIEKYVQINVITVSRPKASHDAGGQNEIEGQTLGAPTATHLKKENDFKRED